MSNLILISIIIGLAGGIGLTTLCLVPFLKKKGVKIDRLIEDSKILINGTDAVISTADKLMPKNKTIDKLKVIESYAKIGVAEAEQLYLSSNLKANERNTKAKDTIYNALKLCGIEKTPEIEKIVDGVIESEVLALGHAPKDISNLQVENSKLVQENVELKNKLDNIKASVV